LSVAKRPSESVAGKARRKDTQRGHGNTPDHRKNFSGLNQGKENSLKTKPKSQRADPPELSCKDEVTLIADYLARRLKPKVLAAFEMHQRQCSDCTAFLNTYEKTIEATKSFLRIQSLQILPKPFMHSPKGPRSLAALLFWLHLFISHAYLTT
jgi:hypothetical protein